jgi:hypothetical protein
MGIPFVRRSMRHVINSTPSQTRSSKSRATDSNPAVGRSWSCYFVLDSRLGIRYYQLSAPITAEGPDPLICHRSAVAGTGSGKLGAGRLYRGGCLFKIPEGSRPPSWPVTSDPAPATAWGEAVPPGCGRPNISPVARRGNARPCGSPWKRDPPDGWEKPAPGADRNLAQPHRCGSNADHNCPSDDRWTDQRMRRRDLSDGMTRRFSPTPVSGTILDRMIKKERCGMSRPRPPALMRCCSHEPFGLASF